MSQSIIRTNYPVVGKAVLDCHSGTMSGHFRDVFCIRGIGSKGFSRYGRERNAAAGGRNTPRNERERGGGGVTKKGKDEKERNATTGRDTGVATKTERGRRASFWLISPRDVEDSGVRLS